MACIESVGDCFQLLKFQGLLKLVVGLYKVYNRQLLPKGRVVHSNRHSYSGMM